MDSIGCLPDVETKLSPTLRFTTHRYRSKPCSREQRVGAVADYILGKRALKDICARWDVSPASIRNWLHASGHFRNRNRKHG